MDNYSQPMVYDCHWGSLKSYYYYIDPSRIFKATSSQEIFRLMPVVCIRVDLHMRFIKGIVSCLILPPTCTWLIILFLTSYRSLSLIQFMLLLHYCKAPVYRLMTVVGQSVRRYYFLMISYSCTKVPEGKNIFGPRSDSSCSRLGLDREIYLMYLGITVSYDR